MLKVRSYKNRLKIKPVNELNLKIKKENVESSAGKINKSINLKMKFFQMLSSVGNFINLKLSNRMKVLLRVSTIMPSEIIILVKMK